MRRNTWWNHDAYPYRMHYRINALGFACQYSVPVRGWVDWHKNLNTAGSYTVVHPWMEK